MYEWFIANRELLKLSYGILIFTICMIIVARTNKLFKLSFHQGIRYFRNAFLFFGLAFFLRYILEAPIFLIYLGDFEFIWFYHLLTIFLFQYFLIMAGFFLLYSLIWKKIEGKEKSFSSLLNPRIGVFYLMTFIIVLLDFIWATYCLMFFSQIILFTFASAVSYLNYTRNNKNKKFSGFYFLAMLLSLIAWVLNALAALLFEWNQFAIIGVYTINSIIFILFLFGVMKVTRKI